jgi:uncharacterized protein DUF1552
MKLLKTDLINRRATSRRQLLKALGVTAAAAPFVPALDGWAAGPGKGPQRLVLLFAPHGVNPNKYWPSKGPSGAETDFAFPAGDDAILKPLLPHKADMIFFDGLKRDTSGPGDHERLLDSLYSAGRVGPNHKAGTAATIDQIVAQRWKPALDTSFPSLQFAVQNWFWAGSFAREGAADSEMIYSGPDAKIPAEWDPYKMYGKLFGMGVAGAGAGDAAGFERLRAQKKSLLDFVNAELKSMQAQVVGKDDRNKIQYHLDAVRDVERTLQAPAVSCGAIEAPDGTIDNKQNDNHPILIPIMNKLLVAALRCDRTRIASMQYSRAFSEFYFRWLPNFKADKFHHDISHIANDPRIGIIQQWYQARFSELLQMFKDTTEFGEPMLNNMLVVNAMEMHTPWNHDCANRQPNWIAGKLGGVIPRTGRLLDYKGANDHNQFLVTILHAFGLTDINTIGALGNLPGKLPNVLG